MNPPWEEEVLDWVTPSMRSVTRVEFDEKKIQILRSRLDKQARFRVNLFEDNDGVGAVLRLIPSKILSIGQLGLPGHILKLAQLPKGLVLVTGATGSGKSTTLAAMIDFINRNKNLHIITLEDPIEYVHTSQKICLVNQRENPYQYGGIQSRTQGCTATRSRHCSRWRIERQRTHSTRFRSGQYRSLGFIHFIPHRQSQRLIEWSIFFHLKTESN